VRLAEEAQQAQRQVETERLRNALAGSVSHDLRTPLTAITGRHQYPPGGGLRLDAPTRHALLQTVHQEADRLHRLVSNVLAMTRLRPAPSRCHKEWQPLEEVVGARLMRLEVRYATARSPRICRGPALVPLDGVLIEQVLINVLDNALKYTPPGVPCRWRPGRRTGL